MSRVRQQELRATAQRLARHLEGRWLVGPRTPVEQAREVLRLAIAGGDQDVLRRRFSGMAWSLLNQSRVEEARRLSRETLTVLDEPRVHHALARSAKELGDTEEALREYDLALKAVEQAAAAERPPGTATHHWAELLTERAGLHLSLGRRAEAGQALQKALELATTVLGDVGLEGFVLHELARWEMDSGEVRSAMRRLLRALEIDQADGDPRSIGRTLHSMAQAANVAGQDELARGYYEKSLEFKRQAGDIGGEAVTLHDLALLTPDAQLRRSMHQRSLELGRQIGDARGIAANLRALAGFDIDEGHLDEGASKAREARRIAEAIGEPSPQAAAMHLLATARWEQGQHEEARKLVDAAIDLAESSGDRRVACSVSISWGRREIDVGDPVERAGPLLERARELARALNDPERLVDATRFLVWTKRYAGGPQSVDLLRQAAHSAAEADAWAPLVQACLALASHDRSDPGREAAWLAQALWIIAGATQARAHAFSLVPTLQLIGALSRTATADAALFEGLAALAVTLTPEELTGRLDTQEGSVLHAALLAAAERCGVAETGLAAWLNERVLPRSAELQRPLMDRVEALVPEDLWLVDRERMRRAIEAARRQDS